jgi:hypothetical protein
MELWIFFRVGVATTRPLKYIHLHTLQAFAIAQVGKIGIYAERSETVYLQLVEL